MAGKLIFAFCNNSNLAVDYEQLDAAGGLIRFGAGFEDVRMTLGSATFTPVGQQEVAGRKPVIEFTAGSRAVVVSSEKKKRIAETPSPAPVPRPSVFSRVSYPEKKQKKEVSVPELPRLVAPLPVPTTFEMGSTSTAGPLTKTQRRNKNRRIKRRLDREEALAEFREMETAIAADSVPLSETSPFLSGSRFHPLSAARGEESIGRIARSPPRPSVQAPESRASSTGVLDSALREVFQRTASSLGKSKEDLLRMMKGMVCQRVQRIILEDDRTEARVLAQSSSRDRKKFSRQPAVATQTDGFRRPPRPPTTHSDGIILVDADRVSTRPKVRVPPRGSVQRPVSPVHRADSDVPAKFHRGRKEERSPYRSSRPSVEGPPPSLSRDEGGLSSPAQPSSSVPKKVW